MYVSHTKISLWCKSLFQLFNHFVSFDVLLLIILRTRFGGTDGKYHYNDTWVFDTMSKTWSELVCTGYIPSQREGHAAALVDDIMYVFGGRGVDGANVGQLAAFKITSKRWFMFQNMGPEPSARSGHGMAAIGSRVYVLGGVCEEDDLTASEGEESNFVHILDTGRLCG